MSAEAEASDLRDPVNGRHDSDKEVQPNTVARLKTSANRFSPNTGDAYLAVGLVSEFVVHVVGQLSVNADWLQAVQYGVARSLEHWRGFEPWALGFRLWF